MNNHNILKYYGSKLDAKLDSSEYYDYELGRNETDYSTDILDLSTIITYTGLTFDSSVCLNTPIDNLKPYKNEIDVDLVTDNCNFKIRRRTEDGWTLDFIFNRSGLTWNNGGVFYYIGIEDEFDIENYADNNLSFSFSDDGRIKWQSYRYSGYCGLSALTETYYIDSGQTSTLCSGGTLNDFNISITFKRYFHYTDCAIENEGGWNDLITGLTLENSYYSVLTGGTPVYSNIETLNQKWTKERSKRLGTLKIYLNGNPIYTLENWEEIIPSVRNSTNTISQIFGGGTTGSGDLHIGSCDFLIKNVQYYEQPLDYGHIRHHYLSENSQSYNISECGTPCVPVIIPLLTPTPTVTPSMSVTPSLTPSLTPSISATIVSSPTPSISILPSSTPTITPSASMIPSPTPSLTPSPSPSVNCYGSLNKFDLYHGGQFIQAANDGLSALIVGTTDIPTSNDSFTWDDAITQCNLYNYGGYNDWRLPTLSEITTIGNSLWSGSLSLWEWTAYWTSEEIDPTNATGFRFGDGTVSGIQFFVYNTQEPNLKSNLLYVRPVRTDICT